MASWAEFRRESPELAEVGEAIVYQFGVGLAFLATVRADGGPRVHPICPILHRGGLYALLVPSPKRSDLLRDGRFSMHSFPAEDNEDAFYTSGDARLVDDPNLRSALVLTYLDERPGQSLTESDLDDHQLFEFDITTCLLTWTTGHGDPNPRHTVWHAPRPPEPAP